MKSVIEEILKNLEGKANAIYINDENLMGLLNKVKTKVEESEQLNKFWDEIKLLIDLLRDWSRGEYKDVSRNNLIIIIGGLMYIVNPFDILPDFIPGGFIDDLLVLMFVIKKTSEELKKYKEWREKGEEGFTLSVEMDSNKDDNEKIIIIGDIDE